MKIEHIYNLLIIRIMMLSLYQIPLSVLSLNYMNMISFFSHIMGITYDTCHKSMGV